jgi:hypothetical protein
MASSAGFQLTAGRIPGERIATTTNNSDSSTWTTTAVETDSVTAALVTGRLYMIRWYGGLVTTVGGDVALMRMREDDTSGTVLNERNFYLGTTATGGFGFSMEAEFTAVSTGNKTFVVTGLRNGGTGTHHADATANRARYLYVNYISG